MTDRTAIETCQRFFGLTDADEATIAGDSGRAFLWQLWQEQGGALYENPLNILRQEWWHAYEAPGRLDAPPGFWLSMPTHAQLLDYGCGTAELNRRFWIERGGQTVLMDISKPVLDYLVYKYAPYIEAGTVHVRALYNAAPQEFDAITCTDVFEHIPRPILLVRELWKTLKPGGQFLTNFSCSYPHAGHLPASIAQQPAWWQFLQERSTIISEDGYVWLMKA